MWPASALLTGNGVAFVLRVPGTEHGDWWSMHGWWIFAGTSAVALLSKYLDPRSAGGTSSTRRTSAWCSASCCSARSGPTRSRSGGDRSRPRSSLALALIVAGGFVILRRLHLVGIAVGFWLAFAAGIGVLAASGHTMTAAWHVGPIEGAEFWWILVSSPEILVFLFFMITDPKTIPASRGGRRAYAVGVGLLATLLIAPQTTEFATKVAVLSALFVVCAARRRSSSCSLGTRRSLATIRAAPRRRRRGGRPRRALVFAGLVVAAGTPARPDAEAASPRSPAGASRGHGARLARAWRDRRSTAETIARDVVTDLAHRGRGSATRATWNARRGGVGDWLASLWRQIGDAPGAATSPAYDVERMELSSEPGTTRARRPSSPGSKGRATALENGRARRSSRRTATGSSRSEGGSPLAAVGGARAPAATLGGTSFVDVAARGRPRLPPRRLPLRHVRRRRRR